MFSFFFLISLLTLWRVSFSQLAQCKSWPPGSCLWRWTGLCRDGRIQAHGWREYETNHHKGWKNLWHIYIYDIYIYVYIYICVCVCVILYMCVCACVCVCVTVYIFTNGYSNQTISSTEVSTWRSWSLATEIRSKHAIHTSIRSATRFGDLGDLGNLPVNVPVKVPALRIWCVRTGFLAWNGVGGINVATKKSHDITLKIFWPEILWYLLMFYVPINEILT